MWWAKDLGSDGFGDAVDVRWTEDLGSDGVGESRCLLAWVLPIRGIADSGNTLSQALSLTTSSSSNVWAQLGVAGRVEQLLRSVAEYREYRATRRRRSSSVL
ncbi:MAG: hypothetical protein ACI8PZ_005119 [Myxococcota bacterium]